MTRETILAGGAVAMVVCIVLGLPRVSEGAIVPVSIFGVNGNDGGREGDDHDGDEENPNGGDPNPVCTGSAACAYSPNPTNVAVGDSLLFTNMGGMKHTATGPVSFTPRLKDVIQPGAGSCPSDAGVNGNCFSTGKLKRGGSVNIGPLNGSSSFEYSCEIHGPETMLATLTVNGGGGTTTTTTTTAASTTTTATTPSTTTTVTTTSTTSPATTSTTTVPTTTTTVSATTTTATTPSTTTTAPTTSTTAPTTTSTGGPTTTTTTLAACTSHDIVVQLPASQPSMKMASFVKISVIVTNAGNCLETLAVTLSGTINYFARQTTTVAPGTSHTVFFDYTVPVRLEVTLTASAPAAGDATPANNSDTKTYPTTVM